MSQFTNLLERLIARVPGGRLAVAQRTEEIAQQLREQGNKAAKGIEQNSISYMIGHESVPHLPTLHILSLALNVPLGTLIEALGYPLGQYKPEDEQRQRLQAQIETGDPEFVDLIDSLTTLSVEQQEAVAAFVSFLETRERKKQKRRIS